MYPHLFLGSHVFTVGILSYKITIEHLRSREIKRLKSWAWLTPAVRDWDHHLVSIRGWCFLRPTWLLTLGCLALGQWSQLCCYLGHEDLFSCSSVYFCCVFLMLSAIYFYMGFPGASVVKKSPCQGKRCKRCGFNLWVGKIPWRGKWQPIAVFLPGESHG